MLLFAATDEVYKLGACCPLALVSCPQRNPLMVARFNKQAQIEKMSSIRTFLIVSVEGGRVPYMPSTKSTTRRQIILPYCGKHTHLQLSVTVTPPDCI